MFRYFSLIALVLWLANTATPIAAQSTPAPPDWNDKGSSVYLGANDGTVPAHDAPPAIAAATAEAHTTTTSRKIDSSVVPSAFVEPPKAAEMPSRHLAPPSVRVSTEPSESSAGRATSESRRPINFGIPTQSLYTMGTGLAIAVGAFLLFAWVLRRSSRGQVGRGILPAEAVSVLGRVSLTSKQVAQLLRVGNKLVLVALTPGGAETLTEVTDPVEVDRLVGLCQQRDSKSTTKEFEQIFQNLSREPAQSGFLGAESLPSSISPVAAAYRAQRGSSARA